MICWIIVMKGIGVRMFDKCYECEKQLTGQEKKHYHDNAETCCSGHECGCMGLPVEPPYCFECMIKGQHTYIEKLRGNIKVMDKQLQEKTARVEELGKNKEFKHFGDADGFLFRIWELEEENEQLKKYVELGKALEFVFEKGFQSMISFDSYEKKYWISPYADNKEIEVIDWYRKETADA